MISGKAFVRLLVLVVFVLAATTLFAAPKPTKGQIEFWQKTGVRFVIRNDSGQFVTWGIGKLETWVHEKHGKWVVRDPKGRFLTHAEGVLETWDDGRKRIVLRKDGKFLAWAFDNADEIKVDLSRIEKVNKRLAIAVFYVTDERFPTLLDHKIVVPVWRDEAQLAETLPYFLKVGYRPNTELINARRALSRAIRKRKKKKKTDELLVRPEGMSEYEFQRMLFKASNTD